MSSSHRLVLLICADQLRADALHCCGASTVSTPNIDDLAKRGTIFRRHYTPAAPCGPARASLLTGLYAGNHGVRRNNSPLSIRATSVASALTPFGIPSYLVGYTDTVLHTHSRATGVMPGFTVDTYFNLDEQGLATWVNALERSGYGPFGCHMDALAPVRPGSRTSLYDAPHSDTAFIADRTIDCIREHSEESCLIHATFLRPHSPWIAPYPYDSLYSLDDTSAPLLARETPTHPFDLCFVPQKVNAREVAAIRAVYAGLVTELDFHVGRIMSELDDLELLDTTLFIFTSDHGELLGDYGLFGSEGYKDSVYHIPLIVADPISRLTNRVSEEFTQSVDIMPTVLEWLTLPPSERGDGFSLVPLLRGDSRAWNRSAAFWEFDFGRSAEQLGKTPEQCTLGVWRTHTDKYVHFGALPPLFFDLRTDSSESVNVAADLGYRDLMLQRRKELLQHSRQHFLQMS